MKLNAPSSPTLVPRLARCIFVTLLFSRFSDKEPIVKWWACSLTDTGNTLETPVGIIYCACCLEPRGSYPKKFYTGGLRREIHSLPLPFLERKGTPFVYLLLTNGTPFTYLVQNFASLLTAKMHWLLNLNKSQTRKFLRLFHSHKIHLLALLSPLTDLTFYILQPINFELFYRPGARFLKAPVTFRARNQIFKSRHKE